MSKKMKVLSGAKVMGGMKKLSEIVKAIIDNELICVLTKHRWVFRSTTKVDVDVGFQPNIVIVNNSLMQEIRVSYWRCERCGLVQYPPEVGVSIRDEG
jgi:hypothetical protein